MGDLFHSSVEAVTTLLLKFIYMLCFDSLKSEIHTKDEFSRQIPWIKTNNLVFEEQVGSKILRTVIFVSMINIL